MRFKKEWLLVLVWVVVWPAAGWSEIVTSSKNQVSVSLTIYNKDLALVRDARKIQLPKGEQVLAFKEISSKIMAQTAVLKADSVSVIEQNFEFDLLTPQTLLNKYIGKAVTLVRENKKTGELVHVKAKVLSTANGIVFQVGNQIETMLDGRLIYPDVPDNLREKPTLTMLIDNSKTDSKAVELSYLTKGLSWQADYVAMLNQDENQMDLKAWVTLTNHSGVDYRNAKLQLVAGDVNRAVQQPLYMMESDQVRQKVAAPRTGRVSQESLLEYHLYTVARSTTVKQNQSKQIAFLQEDNGVCIKKLVLKTPAANYYWNRNPQNYKKKSVGVYLAFKNDAASNFGLPKPAGIIRVYKKDSSGFSQFVGEDHINHTPENEEVEIMLGKAFDVTADRKQVYFSFTNPPDKSRRIYENEYEIELKNAKPTPVTVRVEETIPGEWKILHQSHPHTIEDAATVFWQIKVPAKGKSTLTFRVRTKM